MSEKISLPCTHVSHTAWLVAAFRAQESARKDALFKDPLAAKLIRDFEEAYLSRFSQEIRKDHWLLSIRTYYIDKIIQNFVEAGGKAIVNLGAGLDTRPYRLNIPATTQWYEVDYQELISYKNNLLKQEEPRCKLVRYPADLAQKEERLATLDLLNKQCSQILVLTEGLLPYLYENDVISLAKELYSMPNCHYWLADVFNRSIFENLHKKLGQHEDQKKDDVKFTFMPENFAEFLKAYNWKQEQFYSWGMGALEFNRLPFGVAKEELKTNPAFFESGVGLFGK